ncbi:Protein kinase family protein [Rhynchospora pubera]|uniref:non-specific serine/threonine protein kinase n=1 Tax=Rhynchospora pubera TaxID=906938 RepID=A0AAV8ARV1_9POAL|nr:Protein kinase family protein [Rhynchospora pubera]KAJ4747869.1 Protein kinase family protein [Rhynchospora pubera]
MASHLETKEQSPPPETTEEKTEEFSSSPKGKVEQENSEPDNDKSSTSSIDTKLDAGRDSGISSSEELTGSESPRIKAKIENSDSIETSPQGPLEITTLSSMNSASSTDLDSVSSDPGTDLDAVSPIDQATESHLSVKEEDKHSESDPDEISYQSSPQAVLETSGSSISTDSDTSGIDQWQTLNNNEKEEIKPTSKPDVNATLDTSTKSSISTDFNTTNVDQSFISKSKPPRDASGQWRSLISGLMLRKKKSKPMARAETFPPTTGARRSPNLKWCLERLKNAREDKMAAIMPEERFRPSWRNFDYQELIDATEGFSQENLLGKGGHAEVYKGRLQDGELVAVKRLTKEKNEETRMGDFLSELGIIAHVNHPNAVQLLGFSAEGGLHMVLKFSPHGSLASLLHGSKGGLDWKVRYNIAVGIAEGLLYLHEGCHRRIIHRDIKASNILLTEDYQPQISDFGLAKWLPDKWPHHIVFPIEGTFGYLAPEYFMHGVINEKTDVFAYGVILLELITGRRAVDSSRQSLVIWAKPLLDQSKVKELVDPSLENAYDMKEMMQLLMVASMCIHHVSTARPSMNSVVRLLKGEEESMELMKKWKPKATRPPIVDACDADDYTSSRYLNDLNRYKQLALE